MLKMFPKFDEPISIDSFVGDNIEYDSRFLEIQRLAEGKPEQQYGDTIIEAEEPDWTTIEKICYQLLSETKDLRIFCYYTQAITAKYGLVGFKAGCEAIYTNIKKYWEQIYPALTDEDGDFDPFYRINALSLLISDIGIIKQLNNSYLLSSGLTQLSINLKQAVDIIQDSQKLDYPGGKERLILDIQVGVDAKKIELVAIQESLGYLNLIHDLYQEKLPNEQGLDFDIIKKPILVINTIIDSASIGQVDEASLETSLDASLVANDTNISMVNMNIAAKNDAWRKISIQNRKDVELVLEKVCLYFKEFEPSHPAPHFIRRVQRLMNLDFYGIIKDISPNSIDNLDVLFGKMKEDNSPED